METTRYSTIGVDKAWLLLTIFLVSCVEREKIKEEQSTLHFKVEFNDQFILNTIDDYVKEMHLDSLRSIVSLNVKTTSSDTAIYITHISNRDFKKLPSLYSVVNGYIVFIYTDVGPFIDKNPLKEEIVDLLEYHSLLTDSLVAINDTPILKISKCAGSIIKERDVDVIELPCDLKIIAEKGELKVVKKY